MRLVRSTVAVTALTALLGDASVLKSHSELLQAFKWIFTSLRMKAAQFLPKARAAWRRCVPRKSERDAVGLSCTGHARVPRCDGAARLP